MPWEQWFVFDLGNVVIRIAYERVVAAICVHSECSRDELVELLEDAGGYRDLERGAVTFPEFHQFLRDGAGFSGDLETLRAIWVDFFDGPVDGIEEVMERVRRSYRVAFLSNSNEIHAQVIPRKFGFLFRHEDRFVFSHRLGLAKPDPAIFQRMLQILGATPTQMIFVDDLAENVAAARNLGIRAFLFRGARELTTQIDEAGI